MDYSGCAFPSPHMDTIALPGHDAPCVQYTADCIDHGGGTAVPGSSMTIQCPGGLIRECVSGTGGCFDGSASYCSGDDIVRKRKHFAGSNIPNTRDMLIGTITEESYPASRLPWSTTPQNNSTKGPSCVMNFCAQLGEFGITEEQCLGGIMVGMAELTEGSKRSTWSAVAENVLSACY